MEQLNVVESGALVIAITQLAKRYIPEGLHDKVIPLVAILLGVGITMLADPTSHGALNGAILGLTVTGLYGSAKDMMAKQ